MLSTSSSPTTEVGWVGSCPTGQHRAGTPDVRGAFVAGYAGLRARKFTPRVPNFATSSLGRGAFAKTSSLHVISNSSKPAATTVAWSSASSRAPAIQLVHKSMLAFADSGTGRSTVMSAT